MQERQRAPWVKRGKERDLNKGKEKPLGKKGGGGGERDRVQVKDRFFPPALGRGAPDDVLDGGT